MKKALLLSAFITISTILIPVGSKAQQVLSTPPPTAEFTQNKTVICSYDSVTFTNASTGTVTSYQWNFGTGATPATASTAGPFIVHYSSGGVKTISLTVSGPDGTGNVSHTVNVNMPPLVKVNPTATFICLNDSAHLTASGATIYSWTPYNGLNTATGANVAVSPTLNTTYTVVGADANNCSANAKVTVTVVKPPKVVVTPANSQICMGANKKLTASNAVTYSWSPSLGLSATTGTAVTATPTANSTYTVIGTDIYGCTGTTSAIITVNPNPSITANATAPSICSGASSMIDAQGGNTYTWSPSTGLNQTTGSMVTASPTTSITYTVTGTGVGGCTNTATVSIAVTPTPTVTVSPSSPQICIGSKTTLTANGADTYTWRPSDSLSSTTGAAVMANPTMNTTYTVVGTTNGCIDSIDVAVIVKQLPTANFTITRSTLCTNESENISYTGSAAPSASYTWDFTGASIASGSGQGPFDISWGTGGQKFITLSVIENGCNSVLRKDSAIVNPMTKANAGTDKILCDTVSALAGNKVSPPEKGLWSKISGSGLIMNPNNANTNVTGLGSGNNVFAWTISKPGCFPTSDQVKISTVAPPTIADAGPTQELCNTKTTLAGNSPKIGTGKWSLVSGGATIINAADSTTTITNLITGITILKWTISNDPCPASFSTDTIKNCMNISIIEARKQADLVVFPNPTSSEFSLNHAMVIHKIEIVDILGKICFEKIFSNETAGTTHVSMNNMESGVYLLKIYTKDDILLKKLQIITDNK